MVRTVGEIRKLYPEAILQVAAHSVSELIVLIERFAALAPDLVSVPLPILCGDDAHVLLRSERAHYEKILAEVKATVSKAQ